jgi:HEAT repeat protein
MAKLVLALMICVFGSSAYAEGARPALTVDSANDPIPSIEEQLREHHVAINKAALVAALMDPDADVRALAAAALGDAKIAGRSRKVRGALRIAMAKEIDPEAKIWMAGTLLDMGDLRGDDVLRQMCGDLKLGASIRLTAARFVVSNDKFACHEDVLKIAATGSPVERLQAFSVLDRYRALPERERSDDLAIMCRELDDPDTWVRQEAITALGYSGLQGAIQCLEDAMANETQQSVRSLIQTSIDKLEEWKWKKKHR